MSGRSIAREAHINHQACAVAVRNLETLGIFQRQGGGRTQLIRFNFENYLVKNSLLPLLRQERELLKKMKQEIAQTFKEDTLAITLFGSTARGHDMPGSDMDVLLLVDNSRKNKVQNRATAYSPTFIRHYGIRLSPIVMTVAEAKRRSKKSDPLLKNVLSEGVDLLPKRFRDMLS
jgi:predicted nucleotidyltransferase